ncbi:MAG: hypothetical protein JXA74_09425 [Anaerolineae bacterium]|nr:hypothetical protein [Anaerolineae bacterium]
MATIATVGERQTVWATFARDRAHLYDQYLAVPYDPASGDAPKELARWIEAYLARHPKTPRVVQKAQVFHHLLTRARICVDPLDPYPDKLNHAGLLRALRQRWHAAAKATSLAQAAAWYELLDATGAGRGVLDTGHISPGWNKLFSHGLLGLMAEAEAYRAVCSPQDPDRLAFYDAVLIACRAAIVLSERFAHQAECQAREYTEYREHLSALAEICRRVPANPPETLHEALYFAWLMHELIEMEGEAVRSLGRLDSLFYPYYQADLEAGRLTPDEAKQLFQYYWIKSTARTRGLDNGAHFCLAGQRADGSDASNELTELILDAYEALNAADPKLSVRLHAGSPPWLARRVLEMIRAGHNAVVLMNDEAAVPALVKRGKRVEDARTYLPIGCYEPAVDGLEAACTTNLVINLVKPVELALNDGVDPLSGRRVGPPTGAPEMFKTFDGLLEAYLIQLDHLLARSREAVAGHERHWTQLNPSPLIAATIDDCLARGLDIGEGGARYNAVGCVGAGLANAADSLLALKHAVYDEGRCTLAELIAALQADFVGYEALRQYLVTAVSKWGNGEAEADQLGLLVADHYCRTIHGFTNERGGPYQAALYSFTFQWALGRDTGATPDGRRARQPLAPGVGAMAGRDRAGITALFQSVGQLDFTETPNGSVLDVRLHPSAVAGDAGLDAMVALVETFFTAGPGSGPGFALQFDVLDADTLRAAQARPEDYASLQVRVAGYSAYFVNLPREMQDHLIAQLRHDI